VPTLVPSNMAVWNRNYLSSSSASPVKQVRYPAKTRKSKQFTFLSALKLLLSCCIVFLAAANVSMHYPVITMQLKHHDIQNLVKKEEFLGDKKLRARGRVNAQKRNNNGNDENNNYSGDNLERDTSRNKVQSEREVFNSSIIERFPSALHPLTYPKCCQMASSPKSSIQPPCDTVCYTEEACNDELYPYFTKKDKLLLSQKRYRPERGDPEFLPYVKRALQPCHEMNSLRKPQYQWCQQWIAGKMNLTYGVFPDARKHFLVDPYAAKLPPPGCSLLQSGGGSGSYQHVILFPKAKLAFCGIPKVGITQWLQFLRFTVGAKDYQSFPHSKPDVDAMRFDTLQEHVQMKILNDPEWKFAAFIRNPVERLLSAYLDKVASEKQAVRQHFQKNYGLNHTISFREFVNYLGDERQSCPLSKKNYKIDGLRGVDWCANPHWRPQTFFCGLSEFLPRFSFIGALDHIEHQSRALLQSVGLWESHGKYYHWVDDKKEMKGSGFCEVQPPKLRDGQELIGFQQRIRRDDSDSNTNNATMNYGKITTEVSDTIYGHSTNSRSKIDSYYNSPDLLEKVKLLYEGDYKLWNLIKDKDSLSSGVELASKLSSVCNSLAKN